VSDEATDANGANGDWRRKRHHYELVRNYTLLFVGVGLVVYGVAPPTDPAVFTFGGTMLGANPMVKAAV
jgi:hypothetical protein